MGNEESAPGRQERLPRVSEEEYERLEGARYVIFPHLLDPSSSAEEDEGQDETKDVEGKDKPQQQPRQAVVVGHDQGHAPGEQEAGGEHEDEDEEKAGPRQKVQFENVAPPAPPPPRAAAPSWQHMVDVLQRDITDLAAFHQALVEMKTGPPPLVAAFKGIFAQEPAFEPRFFSAILPTIQRLALRLPEVFPAEHRLPLLVPNQNGEVTLTQEQCAVVLASGFMGTLWVHPTVRSRFRFPGFKIQDLFTHRQGPSVAILRMVLHYFERLSIQMPQGKVTFRRQVLTAPPDWANSTKPLVPARVSNQGKIEDSDTTLHADFANQYIGGGVLHGGCVQEEILFGIKPECLVSMLFCAKMNNNEAIFITGAERFSDYRGYGHGLAFGGNYVDRTPRDDEGRIVTTIVAIDAVVAFGGVQWQEGAIVRDLNKVYCGCWEPQRQPGQVLPAFATGNWGCGAFGGDKSLKVLQQMMAAAEADREVLYHTFGEKYGDRSLKEWITLVNELILKHHPTVGEVYNLVRRCAPGPGEHRNVNLFAQLLHHYEAKEEEQQQEQQQQPGEEEQVQKSAD